MKLNNEGWDCQKKLIKNITQNKRNWNHKNEYQIKNKIKIKWLGIKSKNKIQLEKD